MWLLKYRKSVQKVPEREERDGHRAGWDLGGHLSFRRRQRQQSRGGGEGRVRVRGRAVRGPAGVGARRTSMPLQSPKLESGDPSRYFSHSPYP